MNELEKILEELYEIREKMFGDLNSREDYEVDDLIESVRVYYVCLFPGRAVKIRDFPVLDPEIFFSLYFRSYNKNQWINSPYKKLPFPSMESAEFFLEFTSQLIQRYYDLTEEKEN